MTTNAVNAAGPTDDRPPPAVLVSREEALAATCKLKEGIAGRAEETESARSVSPDSIAEMVDAGLFGIVTPKRYGGSELGFATLLEVQAEIGSACASTGWVYGVLAGHTWLAALFPEQAQDEVFADPRSLIASLIRLGGRPPERVPGGFSWRGGTGRFCSGIDHSDWVLVGGLVSDGDGAPEPWYFLIPRGDVEIVDDWYTVGLRGTGSKSLVVTDAFIPEHRAVRFADLSAGNAPGAAIHEGGLYRQAYDTVWPFSLPGAAVGAGRAALEVFTISTRRRLEGLPPIAQASNGTALARIAKAASQIDAATYLLLHHAEEADKAPARPVFDTVAKARRQRDLAFAVQQVREAVNTLYEASGGSGVYESGAIQRWWRDVNTAAEHVAFTWDLASVAFGRAAVGLGPGEGPKPGPGVRAR
ncbi:acyl-CoA dehydrogenase family protein [Streptomyces sp. NPDC002896]|uniref:acyl-CoA dehydrogenase family protein n=1 Tax=Streptomyces sp. NPDC002896 TaxID=3154438 RepID=UPI00332CB50A